MYTWNVSSKSSWLAGSGVGTLAEQIARQHTAAFGHIARLADNVPARLALRCQIDASLGRLPSNTWKRRSGRPRNRWLDIVWQDSNCSPADLWRRAVLRGHGARTTLLPLPAMWSWWRWWWFARWRHQYVLYRAHIRCGLRQITFASCFTYH